MSDIIRFPGGEVRATDENWHVAIQLQDALIKIKQLEVIETGRLLCEMEDMGFHYLLLGDDDKALTMDRESAMIHYATKVLGMSRSDAYRKRLIYRTLVTTYPQVFEEWTGRGGALPAISRLEYLSHKERFKHPEAERLLRAAKDLDSTEWEAEKRIVLEGKSEDQAHEEAETVIRELAQAAGRRESPIRGKWESKYYREWIGTQCCVLTGKKEFGRIHPAHVQARGMGGGGTDFCNVVPLLYDLHQEQHQHGWEPLLEQHEATMEEIEQRAVEFTIAWFIEADRQIRFYRSMEAKQRLYEQQYGSLNDLNA